MSKVVKEDHQEPSKPGREASQILAFQAVKRRAARITLR